MASSSQPVTLQLEALSAVHNEWADREKKDLKRKLANTKDALEEKREELREEEKLRQTVHLIRILCC